MSDGFKKKELCDVTPEKLCAVSSKCGGCSQVEVPYDQQLEAKNLAMAELFEPLLASTGATLRPILGMEQPFHYRNKVAAPFVPGKRGPNGGRQIITGMYQPGTHRVVQTDECLIENEQAQQVTRAIIPLMKRYKLMPYDENKHQGLLRHAVIRVGHQSGEVLVTLVTNGEDFPASRNFCRDLVKACPFITTIVQNINTSQTNVILGQRERRLYGPGFILDTLCDVSFRISSQSFYQVNSTQTAVLYNEAVRMAGLTGKEVVIDAYCGTGTIGLVAAKHGAAQVIGVDNVESSIKDARQNARHNGIENARFVVGDAGRFMREEVGDLEDGSVDVVFTDPPRAGCSEEFLQALCALAPERVVYVSCNPQTQVRDIQYLCKHGFTLREVQPVDMFPHTDHIESIALLERAV